MHPREFEGRFIEGTMCANATTSAQLLTPNPPNGRCDAPYTSFLGQEAARVDHTGCENMLTALVKPYPAAALPCILLARQANFILNIGPLPQAHRLFNFSFTLPWRDTLRRPF